MSRPTVTIDYGSFAFRYTLKDDNFSLGVEFANREGGYSGEFREMPLMAESTNLQTLTWEIFLLSKTGDAAREEPSAPV